MHQGLYKSLVLIAVIISVTPCCFVQNTIALAVSTTRYLGSRTIHNLTDPLVADISYSPTTPSTGDAIQFTDASTDSNGTITAWSWDFGDGSMGSTAKNPTHQYQKAGTYVVTHRVTDNNGATDTLTMSLSVKAKGKPGFELLIVVCALTLVVLWRRKNNV